MPRAISQALERTSQLAEDLRRFELEWLYVLDPSQLATQNPFAPLRYLTDLSLDEEQRQSEKRRHEHSPRVQNCNVWRETRPELEAILARFESAVDEYNYQAANLAAADDGERLMSHLDEASECKRQLLEIIEHLLHEHLANATEAKRAWFAPAIESTQGRIQELRNQHLALLESRNSATEHLREQQLQYVTKALANHLDLAKNRVFHIPNRQALPSIAGVYVITRDQVIYIGQTNDVRTRFSAHSSNGYYREHDLVSVIEVSDETHRLSLESNLIDALKPLLNKK